MVYYPGSGRERPHGGGRRGDHEHDAGVGVRRRGGGVPQGRAGGSRGVGEVVEGRVEVQRAEPGHHRRVPDPGRRGAGRSRAPPYPACVRGRHRAGADDGQPKCGTGGPAGACSLCAGGDLRHGRHHHGRHHHGHHGHHLPDPDEQDSPGNMRVGGSVIMKTVVETVGDRGRKHPRNRRSMRNST